jgi:hypothetical protein
MLAGKIVILPPIHSMKLTIAAKSSVSLFGAGRILIRSRDGPSDLARGSRQDCQGTTEQWRG